MAKNTGGAQGNGRAGNTKSKKSTGGGKSAKQGKSSAPQRASDTGSPRSGGVGVTRVLLGIAFLALAVYSVWLILQAPPHTGVELSFDELRAHMGLLGGAIYLVMDGLFGRGVPLFPLLFCLCAFCLLTGRRPRGTQIAGGVLAALVLLTFLHRNVTYVHAADALRLGWNGYGGGVVGALFAVALKTAVGRVGTYIVLFCAAVISAVLLAYHFLASQEESLPQLLLGYLRRFKEMLLHFIFVEEDEPDAVAAEPQAARGKETEKKALQAASSEGKADAASSGSAPGAKGGAEKKPRFFKRHFGKKKAQETPPERVRYSGPEYVVIPKEKPVILNSLVEIHKSMDAQEPRVGLSPREPLRTAPYTIQESVEEFQQLLKRRQVRVYAEQEARRTEAEQQPVPDPEQDLAASEEACERDPHTAPSEERSAEATVRAEPEAEFSAGAATGEEPASEIVSEAGREEEPDRAADANAAQESGAGVSAMPGEASAEEASQNPVSVETARPARRVERVVAMEKGKRPERRETPQSAPAPAQQNRAPEAPGKPQEERYHLPPVELLDPGPGSGNPRNNQEIMANVKRLEQTLNDFGVRGTIVDVSCGPAITRYEFRPAAGVKVSKITNLSDDIALSMAVAGVRIEAPIPGKAAVGIELPNKSTTTVCLRELIESDAFRNSKSKLTMALGKDISGQPVVADLSKMPHLLIAGATGSGKSVCINTIINSILYKATPDEVKFVMVDPKKVELGDYNGIPHLISPVVTDPKKAASALRWAVQEMDRRYEVFAANGVKDMPRFNKLSQERRAAAQSEAERAEIEVMPYIVVIIDELADLMMVAPADVEDAICRLAQLARAAGIHLVVATQRPSVDVITGIIKANMPSRIAFAVSSQTDSRTILDMGGAEKLLGRGDMLFYPTGLPKPQRVQGVYVSDKEIARITEAVKAQGKPVYNAEIGSASVGGQEENGGAEEWDELIPEATKLFIENGQASISLLQRRFRIGYTRAARIVDQMEQRGLVGPYEGSKPRQIQVTMSQYHEMLENGEL